MIRSSPRYGLSTPYRLTKKQCWTVPPCSYLQGRPAFGPSGNEAQILDFDNGATSKIGDVLTEHGGLLHVPHLTVGGGGLDWAGVGPRGF